MSHSLHRADTGSVWRDTNMQGGWCRRVPLCRGHGCRVDLRVRVLEHALVGQRQFNEVACDCQTSIILWQPAAFRKCPRKLYDVTTAAARKSHRQVR